MVPSLVHGVNKTQKTLALLHLPNCIQHSHLPSAEGFLSPQNLSYNPKFEKSSILLYNGRTKKENRADLPPVSKCGGNPDNSSAFTEFPSKPESRKKNKKNVFIYRPTRSHYNLMFQCTKCQHWFHPECQDIKLKACQLKHSRTVGCFEY